MNRNSKFILSVIISSILLLQIAGISAEAMQQITYNVSSSQSTLASANFMVTMLKYEPFPVNAGDSFDLWIKVQNIGKDDAKNARFELSPEYPFSSTDNLAFDYGLINGLNSAYTLDQKTDSTQVVLKFRVSVADNAPTGRQTLKFYSITNTKDSASAKVETRIPIDIAKTKTDFEVKLKDISSVESTFVVSNIGENTAKAVRVDIKKTEGVTILSGAEPASLGDLGLGEFTIAHMKAVPGEQAKTVTLEISYTDTSGVRSTVEKTISVDESLLQNVCVKDNAIDYMKWVYAIVGLITGIFLVALFGMIKHKKISESKHASK